MIGINRKGESVVASELLQIVILVATIAFALGATGLRNLLYASLSLGGMAICLGVLYWTLYAPYVGLFQMLIYGGAVVVLFVSVIMYIRSEGNE
jgi:NADH:ubiquinone oxidoreductase subunit 6 (subunit J)